MEQAVFAGGCFWCTEALFSNLKGVKSVTSGYTDGHKENPSYSEVCSGSTGHTEGVLIEFDPTVISYADLLSFFLLSHDPTQLNGQGNDIGTQYRSGIYYLDHAQQQSALKAIELAQEEYRLPIVTEVKPASIFYPAEEEHDQYFMHNSTQPYCQVVISPKLKKAREAFAHLWR